MILSMYVESEAALGANRQGSRVQFRFVVHLLLLVAFAASLATVTIVTEGVPIWWWVRQSSSSPSFSSTSFNAVIRSRG